MKESHRHFGRVIQRQAGFIAAEYSETKRCKLGVKCPRKQDAPSLLEIGALDISPHLCHGVALSSVYKLLGSKYMKKTANVLSLEVKFHSASQHISKITLDQS